MSSPVDKVPASSSSSSNIRDEEEQPTASLVEPLLPSHNHEDDEASRPLRQAEVLVDYNDTEPLSLHIDETNWEHGQRQEAAYRNPGWAMLFGLQLVLVLGMAIYSIVGFAQGTPSDISDYFPKFHDHSFARIFVWIISSILGIAAISAFFILVLLSTLADSLIQISLVLSPLSCGLAALAALLTGNIGGALILLVFSAFGIWYAVGVWHRIPFATANLNMALEAIKNYRGLIPLAYATMTLAILWTLIWMLAYSLVTLVHPEWTMECNGTSGHVTSAAADDHSGNDDDHDDDLCQFTTQGIWIQIGLLCSYFWTTQVLQNLLHTTVAGVVGSFYFTPPQLEEPVTEGRDESEGESPRIAPQRRCCCFGGTSVLQDTTIWDAWYRSSLYSFGTICLGSLLVAILQVLQVVVRMARQQRENDRSNGRRGSICWCLLELIVDYLEKIMEYINSWAFVYVGLYGYEYWTASQKVYQLFQSRGWSMILNDHLIARSLGMMQVFIGVVAGVVASFLGFCLLGASGLAFVGFPIGALLGFLLSSIQFQVVNSAVATIVVCFAESPSTLVENHPPALANRMIRAWRAAYPDECGF